MLSMPGVTRPTVPKRGSLQWFTYATALVSVSPYPSTMSSPAE